MRQGLFAEISRLSKRWRMIAPVDGRRSPIVVVPAMCPRSLGVRYVRCSGSLWHGKKSVDYFSKSSSSKANLTRRCARRGGDAQRGATRSEAKPSAVIFQQKIKKMFKIRGIFASFSFFSCKKTRSFRFVDALPRAILINYPYWLLLAVSFKNRVSAPSR